MEGGVIDIYVAPEAGAPMVQQYTVRALRDYGLSDDRYALKTGSYSQSKREVTRHVSLIAMEAIRDANESRAPDDRFTFAETRRNIITTGIVLSDLIGKRFWVGPVLMEGTEECTPCKRPSTLSDKDGFREAFEGCGGLRAAVLTTGFISVGARIFLL